MKIFKESSLPGLNTEEVDVDVDVEEPRDGAELLLPGLEIGLHENCRLTAK